MSSSENIPKVSNVPPQKLKTVPLTRTNIASLQPEHQEKIVDFILHYDGTIRFLNYLTQCGIFGELGSELRSKAVSRRKYLEKLRKDRSTREFHSILASLKPTSTSVSSSTLQPSTSPSSPLQIKTPTTPPSPQKTRSTSEPEHNMDHLAPQVKDTIELDFEHPEKNDGVWPFKNHQVIYCGERITILYFILPVVDPRDLTRVTVTLLENCKGFKLRQSIIPESLVGGDERMAFFRSKQKKQPKRLAAFDNCSDDEAQGIIASCSSSFAVFCNHMEENTSTRFSERTFKFPDGIKARTNLFGNSNSNVKVWYNVNPFSFGKSKQESFAGAAEWMIALDMRVEKLMNPKKNDKWEELDEAVQG